MTEKRINAVANVIVQAVEVALNPGEESESGLVLAARALGRDEATVLSHMARCLLTLVNVGDEVRDADD